MTFLVSVGFVANRRIKSFESVIVGGNVFLTNHGSRIIISEMTRGSKRGDRADRLHRSLLDDENVFHDQRR
jgi:hypothetical protein